MSSNGLHIGQAFYLPQLLSELQQRGVNTNRLVDKTSLRYFDLSNVDNYIPLSGLYSFMELLQKDQGLDHILTEFYHVFTLVNDNNVAQKVMNSPSLLHVMLTAEKFQLVSKTNYQISLEIEGAITAYTSNIVDQPSKGWMIEEDIDLIRILDTINIVTGKDWCPKAMYLTRSSLDGIEFMLPPGDYPVYLNQKNKKIVMDTSILASAMPFSSVKDVQLDPLQNNLTENLQKLLINQAPGSKLSMVDISELMNCSTKALQRKLCSEGSSFREITQLIRFIKSIELLDRGLQVQEISHYLGYQEVPNFMRAFKNWTGVSPGAYRNRAILS